MDTKSLIILSICALVLLILGSLSNVVGYQSMTSSENDSPLFQTRTQRATNQQQNILTSQYLGMEKGQLLQFPIWDNQIEQFKNAIDILSKMDDKTYKQFTKVYIQCTKQNDILRNANPNEIVMMFDQIRKNPKAGSLILTNRSSYRVSPTNFGCLTELIWFPGCYIGITLLFIFIFFYELFQELTIAHCKIG